MKRTASLRGEKGKNLEIVDVREVDPGIEDVREVDLEVRDVREVDPENGDVREVDLEIEDVREVDLRWGVERDHAREDNNHLMYLTT